MSLPGPRHDGFYQAVFLEVLDVEVMTIEAGRRAAMAGYRVIGEITFQTFELSYNTTAFGADPDQFKATVVVATVPTAQDTRARDEVLA